jgi:UDPglucose--hexose-1-phosphate uridylyltransferase
VIFRGFVVQMTAMNETEMRLDPLRQTWTVFSSERTVAPASVSRLNGGGPTPFHPIREDLLPRPLYTAPKTGPWEVCVIPNRVPAVRVEGETRTHAEGFYDRSDGVGAHEVIVESRDGTPLDELPLDRIARVVMAWKARMVDLARDRRMRAFFITKDAGERAGAPQPHPVSQLIAMALVPPLLRQKLGVAREFYARKKRSIFEDILAEEVRVAKRLVYENNGFSVFCPYASRRPFELFVLPKRQCADFHGITDEEVAQLADALHAALPKLNRALDFPPYNLMLFTAPGRTARGDHWNTLDEDFRWHIEILPRQFPANGLEFASGMHLNTVWPETAAEHLRKIEL